MGCRARLLSVARAVERWVEFTCKFLLVATGLPLLGLLTLVVVLRYVFQSGLTFAPDLSELLFGGFVMAGVALAARHGAHVATQFLLHALTGSRRTGLAVFIHVVTATAYLLLSWYACRNAILAHDQTTPVLGIPWSVGYGCLSLGLALVAVCSITAVVRVLSGHEEVKAGLAEPGASST